ncbi:flavodoxin family protein [Fusibacter paucivorans]|uniref:Flavodoxin family protein n=1 Tax=Fusibacter paucivorans TaxID=76009 RepID=A0ABS5PTW7_9FIRM|nr:flavodoxin family protein [Fusibacter paucivorans]MBS7528536.1 flavodoxin family protein [Fusibacter paucivorans]
MKRKWLAIVGSSRPGKNTDRLVDYMLEALGTVEKEVEKIYLPSDGIITCDGCEACLTTGDCHMHDEIAKVVKSLDFAEGVIFASPTYHYDMSAQMKAFLDRTFYLGFERRKSPQPVKQKAIVLGVCRGTTKESMGHTITGITNVLSDLNMDIIDVVEYYNTKEYPVAENQMIKEIIQQRIIHLLDTEGVEDVD